MVPCETCASVVWHAPTGLVDPHTAMAATFGNFDLVSELPSLGGSRLVNIYRPANRSDRSALAAIPLRTWLQVQPGFAISSDGHHLVISIGAEYTTTALNLEPTPTLHLVPTPA